jgi:hypothetical protein
MAADNELIDILKEHRVRFRPEIISNLPKEEQRQIVLRSLRAVNLFDVILIMVAVVVLVESKLILDIATILSAAIIGYSCWRIWAYRSASSAIKKL